MIPETQLSNKPATATAQENNKPLILQQEEPNLTAIFDRASTIIDQYIMALLVYELMEAYAAKHFEPLITTIINRYNNDIKQLQQFETQTRDEMRQVHIQLREYAKTNGIQNKNFIGELDQFEIQDNLPVTSGLVSIQGLYSILRNAILLLKKDMPHYLSFVGQFVAFNEKHEIDHFTFIPSIDSWEKEKELINNMQPTMVWFSWNELASLCRIQDPKKAAKLIEIHLCKYHLQRLKAFTIEWIHQNTISKNTTHSVQIQPTCAVTPLDRNEIVIAPPKELFWDKPAGCLYYDNVIIMEGDKKNYEGLCCNLFFQKGKPIKKEIYWEEIFKKISTPKEEDDLTPKQKKDRVQKTIKRLNLKTKKKGIYLLLHRNGNYRINPNPKRFPSK